MQRTVSSASSSSSAETSASITSPDSAFSASGRFSRTTAISPSRSTSTMLNRRSSLAPLEERANRALRLVAEHRQREPVARVRRRRVPREVAPDIELRLRVPRRLGQLAQERLDPAIDVRVELGRGHRGVDEPPLGRLRRVDLLAEEDDLARTPLADHQRQPLSRTPGGA